MDTKEAPGLIQSVGEASDARQTISVGSLYPETKNRTAAAYLEGEGSMGAERNQGAVREQFLSPEAEFSEMGQKSKGMKGTGSSAS